MPTNDLIISALVDDIFISENVSNQSHGLTLLPDNSVYLGFQSGGLICEEINGVYMNLPIFVLSGQLTQKREYKCHPGSGLISIKLKSWAAGSFFKGSYELKDRNNPISDIIPIDFFDKLEEKFNTNADKTIAIKQFLSNQFNGKIADKSIVYGVDLINKFKGRIMVDDLAYSMGNSKRTFERKFKEATGLTPKKFITNVRFKNSLNQLNANKDYSEIVYNCGYYDQAHFIHEFKEMTGVSPEYYLTNCIKNMLPEPVIEQKESDLRSPESMAI